jgi:hypothetical protein
MSAVSKSLAVFRIRLRIGLLLSALFALSPATTFAAPAAPDLAGRTDLVPGYAIDLGDDGSANQAFSAGADRLPVAGTAVAQHGGGNLARVESGAGDSLSLTQQGSGNRLALRQAGGGNAAALIQSGSDNSISAAQGGNGQLRVEQSGSRITADVMQGANAPPLTIRQTGGGTYAKVLQY